MTKFTKNLDTYITISDDWQESVMNERPLKKAFTPQTPLLNAHEHGTNPSESSDNRGECIAGHGVGFNDSHQSRK